METHLASCPACSKLSGALAALRTSFRSLPDEGLGFDIVPLVDARLAEHRQRNARSQRRWSLWPLLPQAAAAVASVAGGLALGSTMMTGASAAAAPRAAVMAVFDAVPPGGVCLVPASCPNRGGAR
jgi:anti-sigma factor RsiW